MKNTPEDIIILHKCVLWQPHDVWFLRYWVLWTECFVILDHLFALLPPNSPKNENNKKWKKQLKISSFYSSVLKIMIIGYTVPQIWCMTDVIDVILGYFCPFTPVTAPKMKILKKLNTWWYHHFTLVYQNSWSYILYCSWDMACDRCNYFSFWVIFYPFNPLRAPPQKKQQQLEIASFYTSVPKSWT